MNRKRIQDTRQYGYNSVGRAQSALSVSAVDSYLTLPVTCPPSPAISTVTLTPGRIRNIDQDMETLRASRQDNPFLKQVIASRESLADTLDDIESDDTTLVSRDFPTDLDIDPMTLPEMHEHMIRSPPPSTWLKSPNHRIFSFPNGDETIEVEVMTKEKSPKSDLKHKFPSWDGCDGTSSLRTVARPHLQDRFSLLTSSSIRSSDEDSIRLMSTDD